MTATRARSRRLLAALLGLLVVAGSAAVGAATPGAAEPPASTGSSRALAAITAAKASPDGFSETKTLQRVFTNADGTTTPFPAHRVTVTADHTTNLRGRQRITIAWKGAQPSGGRASQPYGENGLNQEYPVVVMQCRGTDDPDLPKKQQLRPETCWTQSVAERSQVTRSEGEAGFLHDLDADPADKQRLSGIDPFPGADECPAADVAPYVTHLTPFEAAKGAVYPACDSDSMPPEAAVGAAFPAAEIAAFTDTDGTGTVQFEVRSDVENESLGCNDEVACSVVVIPIVGLSCDQPSSPPTRSDQACRKTGRFVPGSSNFAGEGVDAAVSPALWWSASNWKNRFSIPITFGLPPDTCDVLDPRPPTGFYGSELLAQAALQWAPAYCLREDRFKFQLNQMSDEAGWNLMETGGGPAAVVSSAHDLRGTDPVGYAPTAVTGFAVGYVIDKPDNAGQLHELRLNPRLLAKLLTQSYLGSDLGRGHPGIGGNPLSINTDPEFTALNPGLSRTAQEAAATVLSLSNSSDIIEQLTSYIAQDEDAMNFIAGKPDPWGMKVNPAYRDIDLPRAEWPLLDAYVPKTENTCRQDNPGVYFTQIAAPVTTLRKIAEAVLDAWPNVQTRCDFDQSTQSYKLGRIDRQSYGSRFMLGIVSLGDAARYGLDAAALRTTKGTYVAPTDRSLGSAVALAHQDGAYQPFDLDQGDVTRSDDAYPGTMVVYTAARLQNLPQADADKVAQFMRVSVTEGQRPGSGNGELPEGYLPIQKTGVTAKLYRSALATADAVEAQATSGSPGGPGGPGVPGGGRGGGVPVGTSSGAGPAPGGAGPGTRGGVADGAADDEVPVVAMPATEPVDSALAGSLVPVLLGLAIFCGIGAGSLRFFVRRPAP